MVLCSTLYQLIVHTSFVCTDTLEHALQTAFLKGEISTVRSLQEKVDQYEAALDRLRKEIQVNIQRSYTLISILQECEHVMPDNRTNF